MKSKRRDAGRPRGEPIARAVLTETLAELADSGLEGLSVERIAQRAAVNKSSIYRRWPTREALVAAALERVREDVVASVPDTGSLRGDLVELLAPVGRLLAEPAGRALFRASIDESSTELVARNTSPTPSAGLRALIERARLRGELLPRSSVKQLLCALQGAIIHRAMLERAPVSKRWLESLVDLVLYGAAPRAAATRSLQASPAFPHP